MDLRDTINFLKKSLTSPTTLLVMIFSTSFSPSKKPLCGATTSKNYSFLRISCQLLHNSLFRSSNSTEPVSYGSNHALKFWKRPNKTMKYCWWLELFNWPGWEFLEAFSHTRLTCLTCTLGSWKVQACHRAN